MQIRCGSPQGLEDTIPSSATDHRSIQQERLSGELVVRFRIIKTSRTTTYFFAGKHRLSVINANDVPYG